MKARTQLRAGFAALKREFRPLLAIFVLSALLALLANLLRPDPLAWVYDWENHIESQARRAEVPVVSLGRAAEMFVNGRALFVDARPAKRFAEGHIADALSLPLESYREHPDLLEKLLSSGDPLIFYCSGPACDEALRLAERFLEMGYRNVRLFPGGLETWREYNGRIETGEDAK